MRERNVCGIKSEIAESIECTKTSQCYRNSPGCRFRHFSAIYEITKMNNNVLVLCKWLFFLYVDRLILTINKVSVFPIIWLNRSCACVPRTTKNSVPNRYSRHALSTRAYCSERNNASNGYWFFCCACGTRIGASSCWLKISPRLPIVNVVPLFRNCVVFEKRLCFVDVSSLPMRLSFVTGSSNFSVAKRDE